MVETVGLPVRRRGAKSALNRKAAASRFGLRPTEPESLLLIFIGKQAAGELAEAIGRTTGAVTVIMDRLERPGLHLFASTSLALSSVVCIARTHFKKCHAYTL